MIIYSSLQNVVFFLLTPYIFSVNEILLNGNVSALSLFLGMFPWFVRGTFGPKPKMYIPHTSMMMHTMALTVMKIITVITINLLKLLLPNLNPSEQDKVYNVFYFQPVAGAYVKKGQGHRPDSPVYNRFYSAYEYSLSITRVIMVIEQSCTSCELIK